MNKDSFFKNKEYSPQNRSITRRDFLSTGLKAGAAAFTTALLPNLRVEATGQYNVLFIIVDDLSPMLGCYGHSRMHTPNIDRLAERGTLFNHAYSQYPLCSPSRTSIITGLRPESTDVLNNTDDFREKLPEVVTLPQNFKRYGYHTQSVGRVAHHPRLQDDENSWSVPSWRPTWRPFDIQTTPSWQALDVEDGDLRDGKTALRAVQVLDEIKHEQFFLSVGFYKPHFPLEAPEKYFELYDIQDFDLPVSNIPPVDVPSRALNNWNSIRNYQDLPSGNVPLSNEKTLELIRAYAASTSYVDAQIGRVLSKLDSLGLTNNTVIVFCSDHGHHLGEHGIWGKQTLFEVSLRSPLIVSVPGQQAAETNALSELVDIYPTLCDVCQLPTPIQSEGLSLMPVIEEPTRNWKDGVFSQLNKGIVKGVSIRTAQYRYTEWGNQGEHGQELYNYFNDPFETVNIAHLPENIDLVNQLSAKLQEGWQGTLSDIPEQFHIRQTTPWDVNNDGIVDIQDLMIISSSFGDVKPENPRVDVNNDGIVNIIDLLLVAAHIGESTNTSAPNKSTLLSQDHIVQIDKWLSEAYQADDGSEVFKYGIANLEALMKNILPEKTVLLPNYPNPFNPETWIPYDLAQDSYVNINIYNMQGETIKEINLGYQNAGTYRTKSRAAFWDGRNTNGELVSSGVYYYSLNAGNTKKIRQMVILK